MKRKSYHMVILIVIRSKFCIHTMTCNCIRTDGKDLIKLKAGITAPTFTSFHQTIVSLCEYNHMEHVLLQKVQCKCSHKNS